MPFFIIMRPRLITSLVNRLFGIPIICFFDDFAGLVPRLMRSKALRVSATFCSLLEIQPGECESEVGPRIAFLCHGGWFPGRRNGHAFHIFLVGEKRGSWASLLRDYVRNARSHTKSWGARRAAVVFADAAVREFAGTRLRPLYRKLYRGVYNSRLSGADLGVSGQRKGPIRSIHPEGLPPLRAILRLGGIRRVGY